MRHIIFASCILLISFNYSVCQNTVYSERVDSISTKPNSCINCTTFSHFYSSLRFSTGLFENAVPINVLRSGQYVVGFRNKIRINNFFAIGFQAELNRSRFGITQDAGKIVPDTIINDKESFMIDHADAGFYFRINFDKRRGNYMGHFLDIGCYGGYNIRRFHFTQNETFDGRIQKLWEKQVSYINPLQYGVFARIGINRYGITAHYMLSDIFTASSAFQQLPKFSFGLEIGFHK